MNPQRRLAYLMVISSVASGIMGTAAQAQVEIAGELFVNVDATPLSDGTLTSITNSGTLGGYFEALGGGATVPVIALAGGTRGIRFDGGDYMQLVGMLGGPVTLPPPGLVGLNPTRTIEVWALNQNVTVEETMVAWGRRGGVPNGSNMSFNYGHSGAFGAVGHWGGADIGWNNAGGFPPAGRWNHLVYTFDGATSTTRVYTNGVLANMEVLAAGAINTHTNAINLGAQTEPNGTTVTAGLRGSLTLGKVRIHDGVLSDAQISTNYNMEKPSFIDPVVTPSILSAGPTHRWSFNEPATNNATDLALADSVGGSNGVVRGAGAQFTGTRLTLAGGASGTQAYGDLPNGLLSVNSTNNGGTGAVSLEGWIRVTGSRTWARIFDFGSTTIGEIFGPGSSGNGADYLFYSAQNSGDTAVHRMELRNEDPPGGGVIATDYGSFGTFNTDLHFVVTWDEAAGVISVYENGKLAGTTVVDDAMSQINDVNDWLGRSNFTADQNMQGEFDEFRIYNHVLTASEVQGNFQTGPNTINDGNIPANIVGQPTDVTTYETYTATFMVSAGGSPAPTYQWRRDGSAIAGATNTSFTLTNVMLGDSGAMFSVIVSNNSGMPNVVISSNATLTVITDTLVLKHRYSFGEMAGATMAPDSVGGADGELRGAAAFNGTGRLVLEGTTSYLNLPNDLFTNVTNITIEAWIQDDGSAGWARIFDFGNSALGEDFVPGTAGAAGTTYMFLAQPSGLGNLRGAYTIGGGGAAEQLIEWIGMAAPTGQVKHITWTSSGRATTGRLYVDGVLVGENRAVTLTPAALGPTQNDWLGRAQFNDPFFRGQFDEFRIWCGAMTPSQVVSSFNAGQNVQICGICLTITRGPGTVTLRWPASATDYVLEASATLGPTALWGPVFDPPTMDGEFFVLTLNADQAERYFRLAR